MSIDQAKLKFELDLQYIGRTPTPSAMTKLIWTKVPDAVADNAGSDDDDDDDEENDDRNDAYRVGMVTMTMLNLVVLTVVAAVVSNDHEADNDDDNSDHSQNDMPVADP